MRNIQVISGHAQTLQNCLLNECYVNQIFFLLNNYPNKTDTIIESSYLHDLDKVIIADVIGLFSNSLLPFNIGPYLWVTFYF